MKFIIFLFLFLFTTPFVNATDITLICQSTGECNSSSNSSLFFEENVSPGTISISHLNIINHRAGQCDLIMEIIKGKKWNDKLSKAVEMKISSANEILFSGKLIDIFTIKNITLNTIKSNESKIIDWSVKLNQNAGNDFQNLITNFDLDYKFSCSEVLGTTIDSYPRTINWLKNLFTQKIVIWVGAGILIYFILAKIVN